MKKKYESPLAEVLDFDVKDMLMVESNNDVDYDGEETEIVITPVTPGDTGDRKEE